MSFLCGRIREHRHSQTGCGDGGSLQLFKVFPGLTYVEHQQGGLCDRNNSISGVR